MCRNYTLRTTYFQPFEFSLNFCSNQDHDLIYWEDSDQFQDVQWIAVTSVHKIITGEQRLLLTFKTIHSFFKNPYRSDLAKFCVLQWNCLRGNSGTMLWIKMSS